MLAHRFHVRIVLSPGNSPPSRRNAAPPQPVMLRAPCDNQWPAIISLRPALEETRPRPLHRADQDVADGTQVFEFESSWQRQPNPWSRIASRYLLRSSERAAPLARVVLPNLYPARNTNRSAQTKARHECSMIVVVRVTRFHGESFEMPPFIVTVEGARLIGHAPLIVVMTKTAAVPPSGRLAGEAYEVGFVERRVHLVEQQETAREGTKDGEHQARPQSLFAT